MFSEEENREIDEGTFFFNVGLDVLLQIEEIHVFLWKRFHFLRLTCDSCVQSSTFSGSLS